MECAKRKLNDETELALQYNNKNVDIENQEINRFNDKSKGEKRQLDDENELVQQQCNDKKNDMDIKIENKEFDFCNDKHKGEKRKLDDENERLQDNDKKIDVDINVNVKHEETCDESNTKYFNGVEISNLTKRQMKKYKRLLKWEASKKEKRAKERLKTKKKKIDAKLNNIDLGPSRKQLKSCKMANSPCKTSVVIDLSFDELMINKDMGKVIKQILRVYTENRRSKTPMQLYVTSFEGRCKDEMKKHNGYEHWDINFHAENYLDIFPKEKLFYLSSESDNVITELEEDKVYIIGGLVDHNAHKGICHKKAVEQGINHGQLPIKEFFYMKRRKVFTINQVFEILLRVSEGKSFRDAFELTLPKRINMQRTTTSDTEDIDDSDNESKVNDDDEIKKISSVGSVI